MKERHHEDTLAVILLVEDDPADQVLTRRALDDAHFESQLHVVNDGEEALDYLFRRKGYSDPSASPRPHLILLDLNLPKLGGLGVLAALRAHDELKSLPVVALTTSSREEDVTALYEQGVNSYIVKPFGMAELASTLQCLRDYWFNTVLLPPRRS